MPRRTVQSGTTVSLFPFLAVLVCAMGSLILLLLIITRHLHPSYHQVSVVTAETVDEEVKFVAVLSDSLPEKTFASRDLNESFATSEIGSARWSKFQKVNEDRTRHPAAPQYNPLTDADVATKARLERERALIKLHQSQLADLQAELTKINQENQQLISMSENTQATINQKAKALDAKQQEIMDQQKSLSEKQAASASLAQSILRTKENIKQKQATKQKRDERMEIVAFDAVSGQKRTPIFIECLPGHVVVQPGIGDAQTQFLTSYSPGNNPLAVALQAYAEQIGRESKSSSTPYALLVVRPGGIDEFYTVGQLLKANNIEFGYELVDADQKFYFGDQHQIASQKFQKAFELASQQPRVEKRPQQAMLPSKGFARKQALDEILESIKAGKANRDAGNSTAQPPSGNNQPANMIARNRNEPAKLPASTTGEETGGNQQQLSSSNSPAPGMQNPGSPTQQSTSQQTPNARFPEYDPPRKTKGEGNTRPNPFAPQVANQGASGGSASNSDSVAPPMFTTIGLERTLTVQVDLSGVKVGRRKKIELDSSLQTRELRSQFDAEILQELANWNTPPEGMHWVPAIEYRVEPGGNQLAIRLETITDQLQYPSKTRYQMSQQLDDLFRR
ncbi:hypothetical protein [Rubinisphaera italica]|uniref:Uncharacterized protein n=1 Tax=Rubinisphaera italica TaxID=2527969 RepID=A0A5C5XCI9_9PLAN|nr:hypothetical protein [Rubinisphaera italica]TWT60867.1 hypothetical protein Pan54_15950 [Rubinisphaera italica]